MSGPDECPLPRVSGRVLMLGTFVLAAAATAVLALGAQDVRLLRLGLVAALWAALLWAFAAARMRREISSGTARADELRAVYQRELEREVVARREHTLTVERELREQAEQAERREIMGLRTELAAVRVNLEHLLGRDARVERVALPAEPARLVPLAAHPRKFDESSSRVAAAGAAAKATRSLTVAGSSVRAQGISDLAPQNLPGPRAEQFRADRLPTVGGSALPTSTWPVNGRNEAFQVPCEDPALRFGPSNTGASNGGGSNAGVSNAGVSNAQRNGRHGAPSQESSGSHTNGSHTNGSHTNGSHTNGSHTNGSHTNGSHTNGSHTNGSHTNGSHTNVAGARRAPEQASSAETQRSVNDLLAAYGGGSVPRRRRGRDDS